MHLFRLKPRFSGRRGSRAHVIKLQCGVGHFFQEIIRQVNSASTATSAATAAAAANAANATARWKKEPASIGD